MIFKRIAILGISAIFCVFAVFAGCGTSAVRCVLEAEKAVSEPEYDDSIAAVTRSNSRSENITSDGKYVGKMYSGATITWIFTAERQANCEISIAVANAQAGYAPFTAGKGQVFSVSFNGEQIDLPEYEIAQGSAYCDNWQTLDLGTFRVLPGINRITYTALSDTDRLNVDYIAVSSSRADIKEHVHFWKSSSIPASCTADGYVNKTCDDCGYLYTSGIINALGHQYGNYHYDDSLSKMVAVCERCGDTVTANTPNSKYFGEVYYSEDDFTTRPDELVYEAEDAFVCLDGGLNNGSTYIKKDDGNCNNPSGGKLVENISNVGNYIRFIVNAEEDCAADLVFRMSNTMYLDTGIEELNPMSDYVYCTVNGAEVDFTFVSFPGFDSHSYFEWRYVVIKDAELSAEQNIIEIGPKNNDRHKITMPNTDVLKIYTDGAKLSAVKHYIINDVSCEEYNGGYSYSLNFAKGESFTLYSGAFAETADYVITVQAEAEVLNLARELDVSINDETVNLEGITLAAGENTVVVRGVPLKLLKNEITYKRVGSAQVSAVKVYTPKYTAAALESEINSGYDYIKNQGQEDVKTPSLIFEAEDADLGGSVSSRDGVDLVEVNIYENVGKPASGNSAIGNFAVAGNLITWRFTATEQVEAKIVIMVASANYDSAVAGNTLTDNLQERIIIKVNGVAVKLDGLVLTVDSVANYYDWKAITISCTLDAGLNEVTLEALAYGAPNMDVLYVYSDGTQLSPVL